MAEGDEEMPKENSIMFDTWAKCWQQGCLLGNGFMGQVVYGCPEEETVELSHVAFFSGSGNVDPYPEKGAEAFTRARCAARKGDHEEVYRQTGKLMGKRGNYGTNLPVGKLCIKMEGQRNVTGYRRFLNLDRGVMGCGYGTEGNHHVREAFTSHEDHVFAYCLEQDGGEISFTLSFDGGRNPCRSWAEEGMLCFRTRALETLHSDGREGTWLCGAVRVCAEGSRGEDICPEMVVLNEIQGIINDPEVRGTANAQKDPDFNIPYGGIGVRIRGAKRAVIYLAMDTWTEEEEKAGEVLESVKAQVCHGVEDYSGLRERHCLDVSALMSRQRLSLGFWRKPEEQEKAAKDVEESPCAGELLERVRQGEDNRRLTELMYQYGRYLLLSSSRKDSPLPAHLQGVWNDDVACRIGWTCDMHLDINTQMNYWISEPGNLGECHQPLFDWMEQRLIPNGRLTARKCYGCSGWVGELVSNAWGYAAPYWNESLSSCPTGGIWQASDYLEHYRYGQDKAFLERRVLPVMEEAVIFFLEYLFEDGEGYLVGGPSISPENAFLADGKKYYASLGCTYETVMIRELFLQYVEICRELGIEGEQETEVSQEIKAGREIKAGWETETGQQAVRSSLLRRVKAALPRLLPYRILSDGTLAEWRHDHEAADLQHRHTSHLLGLFPYGQITPEGTPELADAAAASIRKKLTPCENWEDTGWARSLLTLYSARLREAEQAYHHLVSMQAVLTGPNLLVMHPPTRGADSFMEVYELDGNTGFSMAVMEMLVQSHGNGIRLLPALPEAWPDGKLEGAVVRGGIILDLYWENGIPAKIAMLSGADKKVTVRYRDAAREYFLAAGKRIEIIWPTGEMSMYTERIRN